MSIKIVFLDVDGTVVDNETEQVPESTIRSVHMLQQKGIHIVLASGRSYFFAKAVGDLLGVRNFINFSGAYIRLDTLEIYKDPISTIDFTNLMKLCKTNEDHLSCFGIEESYSNGLAPEIALPILKNIDCQSIPDMFPEKEVEYIGMCLFLNQGKIQEYQNISEHLQFYQWGANLPHAYNIEKKGNSKATAVHKILEHYRITPEEAMAFGDSGNDVEMLQTVGIGIAMGNATERLKEIANFVTKSVENDGIEYALQKFKLL
ncbi:Cof-type HAD-IIB family hydrolase [Paenibacillus sp. F4]|uniref:Cof-type HAD-IIB family hydrolase n=1 Tax=Paenibacillus sp. F4 TaxID=357385 RepID=UPI0015E072C7|nr:Cof-type HAD-IIB family hydrolase [Paenibacillus sp. F4]